MDLMQGRPRLRGWAAAICAAALGACASGPQVLPAARPPARLPPVSAAPNASGPAVAPAPVPVPDAIAPPNASAASAIEAPAFNAAVEAHFPEPRGAAGLPAEPTSTFDLHVLLHDLAQEALGHGAAASTDKPPVVIVWSIGVSQHGTPIEALAVASRLHLDEPGDMGDHPPIAPGLPANGRPTVLLVGGQHGDEPASTTALLAIARQLAFGALRPVLDQINVVLVPRLNADGADARQRATADGTDLNRDHLLLRTPEAQALAQLVRDLNAAVVVDLHEYPVAASHFDKFGAVPADDVLIQYADTANLSAFIGKAAEEWFRVPLISQLHTAGFTVDWYRTTSADATDKKVTMGSPGPGRLRNVAGLSNAVGLLIESRGSDLGNLHFKRRVQSQITAVAGVLRSATARSADLAKLRAYVAGEVAAEACQGTIVLAAEPAQSEYTLHMIDLRAASDVAVPVTWESTLALMPTRSRARPCGYWLAADQTPVVTRLRLLGVRVSRFVEAGELRGETYREKAARLDTAAMLVDVPAGSYYVGLDQPLGHLALAVLEPDMALGDLPEPRAMPLSGIARVLLRPEASMLPVP